MLLSKLHKFLKWFIVVQILFTATSTEETTIITGAMGLAIAVLYCKFTDWFYRQPVEVG